MTSYIRTYTGVRFVPTEPEKEKIEIKDIAQRDGISCACGSKRWSFDLHYSSVDIICTDCGAQMRIPAATADDIDDICCKTTLLIRGQRG